MEVWESDQVGLAKGWDLVDSVADLLDVDGGGEGGLLGIVAVEEDAVLLVTDGVGGRWWVVAKKMLDRSEV